MNVSQANKLLELIFVAVVRYHAKKPEVILAELRLER